MADCIRCGYFDLEATSMDRWVCVGCREREIRGEASGELQALRARLAAVERERDELRRAADDWRAQCHAEAGAGAALMHERERLVAIIDKADAMAEAVREREEAEVAYLMGPPLNEALMPMCEAAGRVQDALAAYQVARGRGR